MNFKRGFHLSPDPIDGGENLNPNPEPFSVSKEDWEKTQAELNGFRERSGKYEELERSHNEMRERFKPFLEGDKKDEDVRPDRSKYGTGADAAEKFVEDLAAWKFRNLQKDADKTREASAREQGEARQSQERVNGLVTKHRERVAEFIKTTPDFAQVVSQGHIDARQNPEFALAVLGRKNSAQIEYHLNKNAQEAYRLQMLFGSDPEAAKEELILMDHQFTQAKETPSNKGQEFKPTNKPGGKSGHDSVASRVKSYVWDEITGKE